MRWLSDIWLRTQLPINPGVNYRESNVRSQLSWVNCPESNVGQPLQYQFWTPHPLLNDQQWCHLGKCHWFSNQRLWTDLHWRRDFSNFGNHPDQCLTGSRSIYESLWSFWKSGISNFVLHISFLHLQCKIQVSIQTIYLKLVWKFAFFKML